jgi:hypothetical protein
MLLSLESINEGLERFIFVTSLLLQDMLKRQTWSSSLEAPIQHATLRQMSAHYMV